MPTINYDSLMIIHPLLLLFVFHRNTAAKEKGEHKQNAIK
jgi:hypothetical protein